MNKFEVIRKGTEGFTSKLISKVDFPRDSLVASFKDSATPTTTKAYSSVQVDTDKHIELNSDLLYMNHSCDPSCWVDTLNFSVLALKEIHPGDELTFFYPSTEWEMSQPFKCWCSSSQCIGTVDGAKSLDIAVLSNYRLSKHIKKLKGL